MTAILSTNQIILILDEALSCRFQGLEKEGLKAVRLFNGFVEGYPELAVDLYGKTLLLHNNAKDPQIQAAVIQKALEYYTQSLPWIEAVILKERWGISPLTRNGKVIWGKNIDDCIQENGIWYAIDLLLNHDASFYMDTRNLRKWAYENLAGKRVLNTFAYTGSLGVAAKAGGAERVYQLDQSKAFLNIARKSYQLNQLPWEDKEFLTGDFFSHVRQLKAAGNLFDCIFLDPPFFSISERGRVDLVYHSARLINKLRPLVAHTGWLVTVNNALFVSGEDYYQTLQKICNDGYVSVEALIPVPEDCTGFPTRHRRALPTEPSPFNHATKIALLRVNRKDFRTV